MEQWMCESRMTHWVKWSQSFPWENEGFYIASRESRNAQWQLAQALYSECERSSAEFMFRHILCNDH